MALTQTAQFFEALGRSRHVLIALPAHPDVDQLAAAAGLLGICTKLGKQADAVSHGFADAAAHPYLPLMGKVRATLPPVTTLLIRVPTKDVPLHDLSYRLTDTHLEISVSPKQGGWRPEDVRSESSGMKYDFIVTLGAADLDALGPLFSDQPDLFFKIPTANLDHDPANEHFGTMNFVDLTAASVTEVLWRLIKNHDRGLVDEEIATALLAGMISKSRSFTSEKMAPDTLTAAAELVALGADRERIVHGLYRTRSVQTLRLWGRALARLKHDPARGLVWSSLTRQDFALAGAADAELADVLDELIATSPDARVAVLVHEAADGTICAIVDAVRPHDAARLTAAWQSAGSARRARVCIRGKTLADAEHDLVAGLQAALPLA